MKSPPKSLKSYFKPNIKTKLLNSQFKHDIGALKTENLKLQKQIAKLKTAFETAFGVGLGIFGLFW